MRVLVIEDDRKLARLIKRVLESERIDADLAFDGDDGVEFALRDVYDVAVVDWMLPGRDGPAVCRAIRTARCRTGVLMLTARSQLEDKVIGLDSGADDYLVKPFAFEELLARIRALSRRFQDTGTDPWELRYRDLVLDLKARVARRGDRVVHFTPSEWRLVEFLIRHQGQILTRPQIMHYVWSHDEAVKRSQVDVVVSHVRRKLQQRSEPDLIETVRGVGYRLGNDDTHCAVPGRG